MKIRPLRDRIIVKRLEQERKTASEIAMPDTAAEKPGQGEVLTVGKGKIQEGGKVRPLGVKISYGIPAGKRSEQAVKVKSVGIPVKIGATESAIDVMGGHSTLGTVKTVLDLSDLIGKGLPVDVLERIKKRSALTDREMSLSLGLSTKTLTRLRSRKRQKGKARPARLSLSQGDRLYRLARLMSIAEQVFEDRGRAHEWFRQPQLGLGNRKPLELIHTEVGAREVEDLLGRIEHGVYS